MRRFVAGVILGTWSALGCAHSPSRLADIAIIDRDSGSRLEMHYFHGEWWVAGQPGSRYAIFVRNRLGERLLTVASVDGINVVTGDSADWSQGGYVFDPGSGYQITGWRKSDTSVAAFEFSTPADSYAARTGRPENLGVIGLALFRERPLMPPQIALPAPRPEASAPIGGVGASKDEARAQLPQSAAPALGTAHGEREDSYVSHTEFARLHAYPDEIIHIRYDSRENLTAMGIIRPQRYYPSPVPDPFPSSGKYVPDPPPG